MKKALCCATLLLWAAAAAALAATSVTATVTDWDGNLWANATYTITFYPTPAAPAISGQSIFGGSLDGSGVLSVSLPSATANGGSWTFSICPQASSPCISTVILVSGASEDVSSALSAVARGPRFRPGPLSFGYADVEVSGALAPGASYYNVASGLRVWSGTAWQGTCNSASNCAALNAANTFTALQYFPLHGFQITNSTFDPIQFDNYQGGFNIWDPTLSKTLWYGIAEASSPFVGTYVDTSIVWFTGLPNYGDIETSLNYVSPGVMSVGTATNNANGWMQSYAIGNGASGNTDLRGTLTLASGTASYTFTKTYTQAPRCTATDTTAIEATQVTTSTTTLTVKGTGTDVLDYVCAD